MDLTRRYNRCEREREVLSEPFSDIEDSLVIFFPILLVTLSILVLIVFLVYHDTKYVCINVCILFGHFIHDNIGTISPSLTLSFSN